MTKPHYIEKSVSSQYPAKSVIQTKEGYKQTEVGVIPEDWEIKSVQEIADFQNGKAHEQYIDEYGNFIVVNSKFISTEGEVKKYS